MTVTWAEDVGRLDTALAAITSIYPDTGEQPYY